MTSGALDPAIAQPPAPGMTAGQAGETTRPAQPLQVVQAVYDPYDVTRVWVRNHHDGGWITAPWTHLRDAPAPFGEAAWAQARDILARRGADPATESEIAGTVQALLDRAGRGPAKPGPPRRDRRVAARTRATARPGWPRPAEDGQPRPAAAEGEQEQDELAAVIPLAVFDAREEAKKWW